MKDFKRSVQKKNNYNINMYMKKILNYLLIAATVCGLSLVATSCKDDTNNIDNGGQPTAEEQATKDANTFWGVAANLVSPFDVTAEYKNKTFEPTIGVAQEGSSTVRVVNCGSIASAARRFTDITGVEIDENTTTYTYQNDAVGTLVYTKTNNATSLATIDVNIKQIPHLQQIVFKTSEQMGTNGKLYGTAYYSFGDVIALENCDGVKEYWMCVRPAFVIDGKEMSYWVTVSPLCRPHVATYLDEKDEVIFKLPIFLGSDYTQMQNLAEMLYAVCNPEQWWGNLQQNPDMDLFDDFSHERAQYFNQYFWQVVQKHWSDKSNGQSICEKLFGYDFDEMKSIVNGQNALHLLYNGSEASTWFDVSAELYESTYSNGAGSKSNMHVKNLRTVSYNEISGNGIKLDCVADYVDSHWICPAFFGDDQPRFIFRFATGIELCWLYSPFESLSFSRDRHVEDVYVLNQKLNIPVQGALKVFTEADVKGKNADDAKKIGTFIAKDGKLYDTKAEANQNGGGAVAMVVYYDSQNTVDDNHDYHGLAIALNDAVGGNSLQWFGENHYGDELCLADDDITYDVNRLRDMLNGIDIVNSLSSANPRCGNTDHPVINALKTLDKTPDGMSGWFVPSAGQLIMALEGMGLVLKTREWTIDAWFETADGKNPKESLSNWMQQKGCAPFVGEYWTCTGCPTGNLSPLWFWILTDDYKLSTSSDLGVPYKVRPFLAF